MSGNTNRLAPSELGTEPINKLLMRYAIPAIVSMIVSSIYNIIDSIFIGHIPENGDKCITALAVALPLMNLSAAFGSLVGAGGATLVSIKLGQKDNDAANTVLGNVTTLNILIGLVIMIIGLLFIDPTLTLFGASPDSAPGAGDGTIGPAREFMTVILLGNITTHLFFGLNHTMRSSGNPKKSMFTTLLTVVLNIAFAPLFIYVFGWGLKGAALATVCAQIISLLTIVYHFSKGGSVIYFQRKKLRLDRSIVSAIFSIGIAPFTLNFCACIVAVLFNNTLLSYGGDEAVGAYGIINRVLMIGGMIVLGFNQGMQPIAGYNFGAGQMQRVDGVLWATVKMATVVMIIHFAVCQLFPDTITAIFLDPDSGANAQKLTEFATRGLHLCNLMAPIVGFQMVVSNFFQSIGKAKISLFMSSTRQLLYLVPMIIILPRFFGLDGIWMAMPTADALAFFTAFTMLRTQYIKKRDARQDTTN